MRIRTIKPEFYQDENLAQLSREQRHLAAALISWADDEGFFRSHPALIAGALFPFDPDGAAFVHQGLAELERVGFVELYEGGIGLVPGFPRHQVINRPCKSKLKDKAVKRLEPTQNYGVLTEDSLKTHGVLTEPSRTEGEGEGEVEQGSGRGRGAGKCCGAEAPPAPVLDDSRDPRPTDPAQSEKPPHPLQAVWNTNRGTLPEWRETGADRKRQADARWRERSPDAWADIVRRIAASAFCRGINDRQWIAGPNFILKPGTAAKVLEGAYDDRVARRPGDPSDWSGPSGCVEVQL